MQIAIAHDSTLHILNVADTSRDSLTQIQGEVVDVLEREGERIVDEAARRATGRGISVDSEVLQGVPSTTIVEYSDRANIDLIVMPTHGRRGLKRIFLGSVTERVINTANVPVISVNPLRDRPITYPCEALLVPTDGSRGSKIALQEGIAVAKATRASLHLVHVVETGSLGPDARSVLKEGELAERANTIIAEATEVATGESLSAVNAEIVSGIPAKQIRTYIDENEIDLAILGTQGQTDFSRYMLGGVSSKLVRTSPIPVMWVRRPESDEGEGA